LHPINYHTETVARLPDATEIKRCTIGTCLCIIHLQKPEDKNNESIFLLVVLNLPEHQNKQFW
jgi:hypothetical protein